MDTVVLDTNVFVAAGFNPRSHAARIVAAVRAGQLRMAWHTTTREEIVHILTRIPRRSWDEVADLFRPEDAVSGTLDLEPVAAIPDPADRPFAAVAAAAGATLITSDAHLLTYAPALGVTVKTPGVFWRQSQQG